MARFPEGRQECEAATSIQLAGLTIDDIGPFDSSSALLARESISRIDSLLDFPEGSELLPETLKPAEKSGDRAHSVTIIGANGNQDTVSGIKPRQNESVSDLLKRLHPDLTEAELARQVKQLLKYNKDYGNDLGDGSSLSSTRDVFLPSVKYLDSSGRVRRIEGPTGRVTEFGYGADGNLESFTIKSAEGTIEEEACRDASGEWIVIKNGKAARVRSVETGLTGDIIVTDLQGSQEAHLTNGTDIRTTYSGDRPVEATATLNGVEIGKFFYVYEGDIAKIFAAYGDDPYRRILLCQTQSPEAMARLAIARGQTDIADQFNLTDTGDLSAAAFVRENLVRSARRLLGQTVTTFDPTIPTNVGCARMVSQVLQQAGFDRGVIDANVDNLEAKMIQRGFVAVKESQMLAGDVVIGTGPGPTDGHIGVYGGNGVVLHNSSSQGVFSQAAYSAVFGGFPRRLAYRYVGT